MKIFSFLVLGCVLENAPKKSNNTQDQNNITHIEIDIKITPKNPNVDNHHEIHPSPMNFNAVKCPRPITNKLQNCEMPPCLSLRSMLETSSITFVNVARSLVRAPSVSTGEKGGWRVWVGCSEFWKTFYIKI